MVKKLLKFLGFSLFFLFALMMFMPKESFYFLLEEQLKPYGVIISNEHLSSSLFGLEIENLEISVKEIEAAVAQNAEIKLLGVYNVVAFNELSLSSLVDMYAPADITHLEFSYSLLYPLHIQAEAQGDFGEARGSFSLLEMGIELHLTPSQLMQTQYAKTLKMLKKDPDGGYSYAKTF
jgi:hypothetical protein